MVPRLAILVGLLAGMVTAALILGGIYALAPESPTGVPTATAAPEVSSAPASASPVASVVASSSPSSSPAGSDEGDSALFHIGEPAPALVVPQVGGGTIDLASLRGKPVWVDFMATYCPPCQDEFPLMNGFATRYAKDGLVVAAVDIEEDEGTVAAFAKSMAATFPLGLDTKGDNATAWDAQVLPVHFWIDQDGIVRDGALGGIGPDIMARGLQTILPGVSVTP